MLPQCHVNRDLNAKCDRFWDPASAEEYGVQYSPDGTVVKLLELDNSGHPTGNAPEDVEFPGNERVLRVTDPILNITRCVNLYDQYRFNPNKFMGTPQCKFDDADVRWIKEERYRLFPAPENVEDVEISADAIPLFPQWFVVPMTQRVPFWFETLQKIYDVFKNAQDTLEQCLQIIGLQTVYERHSDVTWIASSLESLQTFPRAWQWWEKCLRAYIIFGLYPAVRQGPLTAYQKLQEVLSAYFQKSPTSNFRNVESLLQYWMTLPFTTANYQFRAVPPLMDIALVDADNMLCNEVNNWASDVENESNAHSQWLHICEANYNCHDQTDYRLYLNQTTPDHSSIILKNTRVALNNFYKNFFGSDSIETADKILAYIYEQNRNVHLESFSSFTEGITSWKAHLSRLNDWKRTAELMYLAFHWIASRPLLASQANMDQILSQLCAENTTVAQYLMQEPVDLSKILIIYPHNQNETVYMCTSIEDIKHWKTENVIPNSVFANRVNLYNFTFVTATIPNTQIQFTIPSADWELIQTPASNYFGKRYVGLEPQMDIQSPIDYRIWQFNATGTKVDFTPMVYDKKQRFTAAELRKLQNRKITRDVEVFELFPWRRTPVAQ